MRVVVWHRLAHPPLRRAVGDEEGLDRDVARRVREAHHVLVDVVELERHRRSPIARMLVVHGELEGHGGPVEAVAVQGSTVVTAGMDGALLVSSLSALDVGVPLPIARVHMLENGDIFCVGCVDAEDEVLAGGADATLESFTLPGGERRLVMRHPHCVNCVSVVRREAATGCEDRVVRTWSLVDGTCTRELRGHTSSVRAVGLRGTLLASCSDELCVWALDDGHGRCVATLGAEAETGSVGLGDDGDKPFPYSGPRSYEAVAIGDGFIATGMRQFVGPAGLWEARAPKCTVVVWRPA